MSLCSSWALLGQERLILRLVLISDTVKTTFCTALMDAIAEQKRRATYVNLDPAAEEFTWEPTIGIIKLVRLS